jgi:hypothetical protein
MTVPLVLVATERPNRITLLIVADVIVALFCTTEEPIS